MSGAEKECRFAGNPKSGITDAQRRMIERVVGSFKGDFDKARKYLLAKAGGNENALAIKLFDSYVSEEVAKAGGKREAAKENIYRRTRKTPAPAEQNAALKKEDEKAGMTSELRTDRG